MRLWIGLHLSQLTLQVFEPNWSNDGGATVVLDQEKVVGLSRGARAAGIKLGMRQGGVLMLEPNARVHERSAAKEEAAMRAVAMALLQYTPLVTHAEESTLLLEVGGSLKLFGGIRSLCSRITADLLGLGFSGQVCCAPTARAAWIFARFGRGRAVKPETMSRLLDKIPALILPAARPYATWLEGIGCEVIAELRRLPRAGLQRRCGRQLLDTMDSAFGSAPELFDWIEPADKFEAAIELYDRIESADLLLAAAQRLVLQLAGWLSNKQLAVESVTLLLDHERGRVARPATALEIKLAEPVWQGDHIIRLLKERLGKTELEAPVIGLRLEAVQLQPMAPPTDSLFPEPGGTAEDQVRVMEVIVARLGADKVMHSKPIADHRPEVANNWVSVQEKVSESAVNAQLPPSVEGLLRPAWLLAKPIALLVRNHRPFYGSPLRIASGPERMEAGWWSDGEARDYFVAEGAEHALYWIYRERISGGADDADPRYYLHGLFG